MKPRYYILMALFVLVIVYAGFTMDEVLNRHYLRKAGHLPFDDLQTSEFMTTDSVSDMIREIEDPNASFQVVCPSCFEIHVYREPQPDGWTIYRNWHSVSPSIKEIEPSETIDMNEFESQSYCGDCGYPYGTDWEVELL